MVLKKWWSLGSPKNSYSRIAFKTLTNSKDRNSFSVFRLRQCFVSDAVSELFSMEF
jgi:hypothetical protein